MSVYREGSVPVPGYELVAFLGRGSYGEVWKATGPGGTEVAVKFIALDSQQGLKEFRAIGLVKRLRHPNLVPIHAFWLRDAVGNVLTDGPTEAADDAGRFHLGGRKELVIAMGLGDQSLAQKVAAAGGGLPPRELLRYMDGAARGIDYLNEPSHPPANSPIIHCDIKPANLLIVGGEVQVCDYGVALALGADVKKTLAAGTPAYAPPELINNDPGRRTDQYSLAISYVELRTGCLPFDEKLALRANITGELDLSRLDRDERAVIRRATSLLPERRYPTAQEFVDELRVACNVSLSRSGVVSRAAEQRVPSPPAELPQPPAVRATPTGTTPAGPWRSTVAFPESPRPSTPVPLPAAKADEPWAGADEPTPELPVPPTAPPRRPWVWPLAIGLLAAVCGATALVATRPGGEPLPQPPSGEPLPQPPGGESPPSVPPAVGPHLGDGQPPVPGDKPKGDPPPTPPTAADLIKKLDLRLQKAAEIQAHSARIKAAIETPGLPSTEVENLRDGIVADLAVAESQFGWLNTVTVSQLPLGRDRDPAEAKAWFEAAVALAKANSLANHDRLVGVLSFVTYLEAVSALPPPPDELGRAEQARDLAASHKLSSGRREQFLLRPLVDRGLRGVTDGRKPAAVRFLVRAAGDWMAVDNKDFAARLLLQAYDLDPQATTTAAQRDGLPAVRFADELSKKAHAHALEAWRELNAARAIFGKSEYKPEYDAVWQKGKRHAEPAVALYRDAIGVTVTDQDVFTVAERHPQIALWYHERGSLLAELLLEYKLPEQLPQTALAIGHLQTAYVMAARRIKARASNDVGDRSVLNTPQVREVDRIILTASESNKNLGIYRSLSSLFAAAKDTTRDDWVPLSAECAYMQSDRTTDKARALKAAAGRIPERAGGDLGTCRDRMKHLADLDTTPDELTALLKKAELSGGTR